MVGLLFPGQGSQHVGMGRELADAFPEAREAFEQADDVLGFPLSKLAWDGPEDELTLTSNAQPALLTHSIAVYRVVRSQLGSVALAAGHSLGEFSAYVAAGAISFEDGLRIVRRRGELMQQAGSARPGAMAAIIGLDEDQVERVCAEAGSGTEVCVPANFNSAGQIVISGDAAAVRRAVELARAAGSRRPMLLNVSGAFHSPLMQPAEAGLRAAIHRAEFSPPAFPVVSNVTATPVSDVTHAREMLVRQLTSPVRWDRSLQHMLDAGIGNFVELGPGHVLTKLLRRLTADVESHAIGVPGDLTSLTR